MGRTGPVRPSLETLVTQLPTPVCPNGGRRNPPGTSLTGKTPDGKKKQIDLEHVLRTLPTPVASEGARASETYARGNPTLIGAIKSLPTPRANDSEKRGQVAIQPDSGLSGLPGVVCSLPTPTSTDAKASGAAGYSTESGRHSGTTLSDAILGAAPEGRRGTLSPLFVAWMMAIPTALISCAFSATPSRPRKQSSRSRSSREAS